MLIAKKIEDMSLIELDELSKSVESRKKALKEKEEIYEEEALKNKMPQELKDRLVKQVAQLIEGKYIQMNVNGVKAKAHIYWGFDNFATIDEAHSEIPSKSSSLTEFLWEMIQTYCFDGVWQDHIEPELYESKEYDKFNREVAKVCSLLDEYEKTYDDYCWDDILNEVKKNAQKGR